MKKRITVIALLVSLLAVLVVGGTIAYFSDHDTATNTFVQGNVKIDLKEKITGGIIADGAAYTGVTPGIEMVKEPYVINVGKNDAFIRMDVTMDQYAAFASAAGNHSITDLSTVFSGHNENAWYRFDTTVNSSADTATYRYVYGYYDGTVFTPARVSGNSTETAALFTGVTVPAVFTSEEIEEIGDFTIVIDAYAIQADLDGPAATQTLVAELEAMTR